MPGYYGGKNKASCIANTTWKTSLKQSCFSPPLLLHLLSRLPQPAARSQLAHKVSAQPACIRRGMESWLLVCPHRPCLYLLRTTRQAEQPPYHSPSVLSTVPPRAPLVTAPLPNPYWSLAAAARSIFLGAHFMKQAILRKELINALQFRWFPRPCSRYTGDTAPEQWFAVGTLPTGAGASSAGSDLPQPTGSLSGHAWGGIKPLDTTQTRRRTPERTLPQPEGWARSPARRRRARSPLPRPARSRSAQPRRTACTPTAHHRLCRLIAGPARLEGWSASMHRSRSEERSHVPLPVPNPSFACLP